MVTHRSWARSHADSYERLEFLGDSVLQYVVTAELLRRHPLASEGDLAWMRQAVVGRDACAEASRALRLPEAMIEAAPASARDDASRIGDSPSVQAALVEALIGACATDVGIAVTEPAVLAAFGPAIEGAVPGRRDPKTALQEAAAQRRHEVAYELVGTEGPPHARLFETRVVVGGREMGRGTGSSKQASEQQAASSALALMEEEAGC